MLHQQGSDYVVTCVQLEVLRRLSLYSGNQDPGQCSLLGQLLSQTATAFPTGGMVLWVCLGCFVWGGCCSGLLFTPNTDTASLLHLICRQSMSLVCGGFMFVDLVFVVVGLVLFVGCFFVGFVCFAFCFGGFLNSHLSYAAIHHSCCSLIHCQSSIAAAPFTAFS